MDRIGGLKRGETNLFLCDFLESTPSGKQQKIRKEVVYLLFQYCVTRYLIVWPFLGAFLFSTMLAVQ